MRIAIQLLVAVLVLWGGCVGAEEPAPAPTPAPLVAPAVAPKDTPAAPAAVPAKEFKVALKKGQRLAIVGDSITEQKQYSKFMELYLTVCQPQLDLHVIQLGWGGERAPGFAARMANDLLPYKPDVVTTCYGMNDGGYAAFNENTGKTYESAMEEIVTRLKKEGATVVVGSPGAVDTKYYHGGGEPPRIYNETLGKLRDLAHKVADKNEQPFADVFTPMETAMVLAKAKFGETYDVCGTDGVHPRPNGHLVMAYAFLKSLGVDGQIGTLTVDMKGQAEGSEGHKILSANAGKVEVESSRYPFCFFGDDKSPDSTKSILPYVPFNAELNRFTLIVKNLDAEKAKVTWGKDSKSFTKAEMEKGVNLAEAFLDNPFCEAFKKMDGLIANKQNFETLMIKQLINQFPRISTTLDKDKDVDAALEVLRKKLFDKYEKFSADVKAAVTPVKHTLVIEAEK